MRRYYYLISYIFTRDNGSVGVGTGEASTHYPITEWSDIKRIKESIKKTFTEDVTIDITSYQLIREDSIWGRK